LRGHPGVFGITTVVRNADVEAGGNDRIADAEARVAARGDGSREVYAANAGVAADDAAGAGCRQRVLEINARVGDLDRYFARIQLRFLELDEVALVTPSCSSIRYALKGLMQAPYVGLDGLSTRSRAQRESAKRGAKLPPR
jgi:hypothetical protein